VSSSHRIRAYVELPLTPNGEITLPRDTAHHLCKVLRLSAGAAVGLFNGDGHDYDATLLTTGKTATVRVLSKQLNDVESSLELELIQGISRADRMDTTLQKAVELGVSRIRPVLTEKCTVRLQGDRLQKKVQHWRGVIISACEQSGRSTVPELCAVQTLEACFAELPTNGSNWFFQPGSHTAIGTADLTQHPCRLIVGPESGISEREIELCTAAGFNAVSLGPRILRTETAGPAAIAILQSRFGDLR